MDVRLDAELVSRLVTERGGVMAILGELIDRSSDGDSRINKATVHRWMKGQLPKNSERLLTLAGLLDVDPFALLSADEADVSALADNMLEIVQHENATPAPLQMLRGFFGRQKEWPPQEIASTFFNRDWHTRDFEHTPQTRKNFYQVIELVGHASHETPQVFHFAFQSLGRFSARWLEYGFVMRNGPKDTLRHIFGFSRHKAIVDAEQPVSVATWFGEGAATFRVASLHEFEINLSSEDFSPARHLEFPV